MADGGVQEDGFVGGGQEEACWAGASDCRGCLVVSED